jgi:hypothetical protein
MSVERRQADGSVIVRANDTVVEQGVMITPTAGGGVIVVSGCSRHHPLDTIPALLDRKAARELWHALGDMIRPPSIPRDDLGHPWD